MAPSAVAVRVVRARAAPWQTTTPGRDEAREGVDVAVGVVVEQPVAEPEHLLDAERVAQPRLDLRARPAPGCGSG